MSQMGPNPAFRRCQRDVRFVLNSNQIADVARLRLSADFVAKVVGDSAEQ